MDTGKARAEEPRRRVCARPLPTFGDTAPEADLALASGSEGYTVVGVPVAENALAVQVALESFAF